MEDRSEFSVKVKSMLRRAGLGEVPVPVLACVGALCAGLLVLALVHFWPAGTGAGTFETTGGGERATGGQQVSESALQLSSSQASAQDASSAAVAVDVEGAVRKPGVYELAAGARVVDAVDAAGGFARNASRTSVNLAQKLEDGAQVYVATKREANAGGTGGNVTSAGTPGAGTGTGAAKTTGSSGGSGAASGKVNINTASAEELQTLSGIGPSLSQRIVEYRESKGAFSSIEGLKEVSGIGDARFESIKDSVCV